jgi:transcriptional regulator with XRE-family HTH domain
VSNDANLVLIGQNIRSARKSMHWNQSQLGKLLSVTRQTILAWEQGDTPIPSDKLIQIAHLVGHKDVTWFFEENWKKSQLKYM